MTRGTAEQRMSLGEMAQSEMDCNWSSCSVLPTGSREGQNNKARTDVEILVGRV